MCVPCALGVCCYRLQNMKSTVHVEAFAALFTVAPNRLDNDSLRLSDKDGNPLPGVNMEAFRSFIGGQVARPGEGDESTVDKEILDIVIKHYESKVDSLDPEANSAALLKRANGWHKRPEKAAANGELRSANSKLLAQKANSDELVLAIATAEDKHGTGSPEWVAAQVALQTYMMENIGK